MSAQIVAVVNQKGGSGKTTLAMQLAGTLAKRDERVLVVDADPQGTATRWAASASDDTPFPAAVVGLSAAGGRIHREVAKFISDYAYIIIDCPPAMDSPVPQSALLVADLGLVPVIPSPLDLWAAVGIRQVIERIKDVNDLYGQKIEISLFTSIYALDIAHPPAYLLPLTLPYSTQQGGIAMDWKQLLAYISGSVDEELLLRNEYLVAENHILRHQLQSRVQLTDAERKTLAELGHKLGKQALAEVATIVKPETILGWYRRLVAQKFDGSNQRKSWGRPRVDKELEDLVVRMARENRAWGYDRIAGALAHLGYEISDQTVGNILKCRGLPPAPERKTTTTWKEFIRSHMDVLVATDFFTAEVWTLGGLVTFYILFFIELDTRLVHIAGVTPHPNAPWMRQIARHLTMAEWGFLKPGQYLIHDRDTKFCSAFRQMIDDAGVTCVPLPPRSPYLNAFAERFVRSVKEEALSRFILFGERSLRHVLTEYLAHYHKERPHQGKGNAILLPSTHADLDPEEPIRCRERLGGLLKYYHRKAA